MGKLMHKRSNSNLTLPRVIMTALLACTAGCSGSSTSESKVTKPTVAKGPERPAVTAAPAKENEGKSTAWMPDKDLMSQLKQTGEVADYQLLLPADLAKIDTTGKAIPKMALGMWLRKPTETKPPAVISVSIFADEKMVAEAKKNVRQAMVNFSAGFTNSMGVKIQNRGKTESGDINGIPFSRLAWTGVGQDGSPVQGLAYCGIDNGSVITINALGYGPDALKESKLHEAAIATIKKK